MRCCVKEKEVYLIKWLQNVHFDGISKSVSVKYDQKIAETFIQLFAAVLILSTNTYYGGLLELTWRKRVLFF